MSEDRHFLYYCPICDKQTNAVPGYDAWWCEDCRHIWFAKDIHEFEQRLISRGWLPPGTLEALDQFEPPKDGIKVPTKEHADAALRIMRHTKQSMEEAGWLPPCEGRVVGEAKYDGKGTYFSVPFFMSGADAGRYRVVLDPLPEKEGEA